MGILKQLFIILLVLLQSLNAAEIEILSDEIIYDNKSGLLKFTGDITASDGEYEFSSKDILYNKVTKEIYANNDNILSNNEFNLISEKIKISDDFAQANSSNLHLKFYNFGSFFAQTAHKNNSDFKLDKIYFTTCKICDNAEQLVPLWNIRAGSAEYIDEKDNFYFNQASFYIYDKPVFYMPLFITAGNKYPKRTGLLDPEYSSDSIKGSNITLPLFINIKPNFDLTYTPTIFRNFNINHDLEFRHMTPKSHLVFDIAYLNINEDFQDYLSDNDYTTYDRQKWRIKTKGNYSLNSGDLTFDIHRTSRSEYLSRYLEDDRRYEQSLVQFIHSEEDLLVKYSYVNDFSDSDRSYYRLPNIDYKKNIKLGKYDLNMSNLVNYDNIKLEEEASRDRISYSNILSNSRSLTSGDIINYGISNRFDNYGLFEDDNSAFRYQVGVFADWSRNYINMNSSAVLTPKFYISSSKLIVDDSVSNYDSQANQLNFANLTRINNAFGYDIIDESMKLAFEVGYLQSSKDKDIEYKFGIKYSDEVSSEYEMGSGLDTKLSDLMNSFSLSSKQLKVSYFNRLYYEDLFPYYNSFSLSTNLDKLSLATTISHIEYSHLDSSLVDDKTLSTSIGYQVSSNLNIINTSSFSYIDQSIFSGAMTENQLAITYQNSCIKTKLSFVSRFYSNDDVKDDRTIRLSIDILGNLD
ncbi:MAG: LPS-assembly protein LptD [Rickettsiales bacterium]|nr:LPS-assembly protein LptD [Rickettsiales bacterium]